MLRKFKKTGLSVSVEAIRHQSDLRYRRLATLFTNLQAVLHGNEYQAIKRPKDKMEFLTDKLDELGLEETVLKDFGIKCDFKLIDILEPYMAVGTSFTNINSALVEGWRKPYLNNDDYKKVFKDYRNDLQKMKAVVNRKNATVGGYLSKLTQKIYIGVYWLDSKYATPEEAAAVLLHEIGHVFTYYETAISETFKNELMTAFRQMNDPAQQEELTYFLYRQSQKEEGPVKDIVQSKDVGECLLLDTIDRIHMDEIGNLQYSGRGWEQLADDFAIKLGAGAALATAMDKATRLYDPEELRGTASYLIVEICKMIGFASATILAPGPGLVVLALRFVLGDVRSGSDTYDNIKKRFARMRQETIGRMRDSEKLSTSERKELLKQVEVIDAIEKEYHHRRSFFDVITTFGGLRGRKLRNSNKEMALLEELANNELHLLKNKIDALGAN